VPAGQEWIHEIKYDGYRMMVVRDRDRVRLFSRGGHDWADRFPLVVSAALKLPQERFVLDGEVVVLRQDGTSDFDALASRKHDKRRSSMRSTCSPARMTCVGFRLCGAKTLWRSCSLMRSTASFLPSMSKATLAMFYSASPATWALRGLSRSTSTALMVAAAANTG
jgi:hypothetical protein